MKDISSEIRSVLSIINQLTGSNTSAKSDAIRTHPIWVQLGRETQVLVETLGQLLDDGLVSSHEGTFTLTEEGLALVKKFKSQGFSTILVSADQSRASHKFCQRVYNLDLCQFNSMSMVQLEKLLEVMGLCSDDHILDLGCGAGRIAEYISDRTGARVTGVDFAAGAIERARERTPLKRNRLVYEVMDLDDLSLPEKRFSAVISIDALHFARDIRQTIQQVQAGLVDGGRMGIFFAANLSHGELLENLKPDETSLARALISCGYHFRAWDFTEDERELWEKILIVAEDLRNEYEDEGKRYLYEMAVSDARPMLEAVITGWRRRYLYYIW